MIHPQYRVDATRDAAALRRWVRAVMWRAAQQSGGTIA
jgi:hypothetical protein